MSRKTKKAASARARVRMSFAAASNAIEDGRIASSREANHRIAQLLASDSTIASIAMDAIAKNVTGHGSIAEGTPLGIRAISIDGQRREFTPAMPIATQPISARYVLEVLIGHRVFFLALPESVMETPLRNVLIENLRLGKVLSPASAGVAPMPNAEVDVTVRRDRDGSFRVSVEGAALKSVRVIDGD